MTNSNAKNAVIPSHVNAKQISNKTPNDLSPIRADQTQTLKFPTNKLCCPSTHISKPNFFKKSRNLILRKSKYRRI
jgi:hypothetical protein